MAQQHEIINRQWFLDNCDLQEIPETIDEWVSKFIIAENGIQQQEETLTFTQDPSQPPVIEAVPNPPPLPDLVTAPEVQFQIYETIGDGTCMVHALLMVCSLTYRRLNEANRGTVGINFRQTVFKNIVMCYYSKATTMVNVVDDKDANIVDEHGAPRMEEKMVRLQDLQGNVLELLEERKNFLNHIIDEEPSTYLDAAYLIPICYFYGINILIYRTDGQLWSLGLYPDRQGLNSCYIINHNGINHFSGMSCSINDQRVSFNIPYETVVALKENRTVVLPELRAEAARALPSSFSSYSSSLSSGRGSARAADFDFNFLSDEDTVNLPLSTVLSSFVDQATTRQNIKANTDAALEKLKNSSETILENLKDFKAFYGNKIPKDCTKINESDLKTKVPKLQTLTPEEITQLCTLANLELLLNQAESLKIKAQEYPELFDKHNKLIPELNPIKWNMFLKKIKLTAKKAKELLNYLDGANQLSALRKAANYEAQESDALVQLEKMPQQKWLREFLTTYKLSAYPIQIALDFNAQDIDDAFVKDIKLTEEQKKDVDFVNGKPFVKSMVTNMSLPTNFQIQDSGFFGSQLTQKLVDGYYETQKIPFLREYAEVILSREITSTVESFEAFDSNSKNAESKMNAVSLPLYIIFACQKRKKKSKRKIWQELMNKKGKPETDEQRTELEAYMNDPKNSDNLYEREKDGNFIYESFHLSIIFLCNGKIYTLGYGSDPFADDEEVKKAADGDPNHDAKVVRLKKIEKLIRKGGKLSGVNLENVQILGTGYIYSPDSLNIDEDVYSYDIIDIGILEKCHVIRINKLLATIKRVRAITMVIGENEEERNVTVEQLSAQTMCVYSRLSSRYNEYFPVTSEFMNCSSFVEAVFYDRIDCTTPGFYSDPNACKKIKDPYGEGARKKTRISTILNAYFGDGQLNAFKNLVNYTSDIAPAVAEAEKTWNQVALATVCTAAGVCAITGLTLAGIKLGFLGGDAEIKLKKRRKHKRAKNATAKKLNNK
jgi:hypothetical protein